MPNGAKTLIDALDAAGVEFVVIGGVAAVAHGSATATFDLDLCYARDGANLGRLTRALAPLHPYLRGADLGLPFVFDVRAVRNGMNFTLSTDVYDLDLLGEVAGVGSYDKVLAESEGVLIYGREHKVLRLEALIRAKKAAGRQKDLNALPELEALLELKRRGGA